MKKNIAVFLLTATILIFFSAAILSGESITYPGDYEAGNIIDAAGMNLRFTRLYNLVNGSLDMDNINFTLGDLTGNSLYNTGGKIGIGTATPASPLTIEGNVSSGAIDDFEEYQILLFNSILPKDSYGLGIEASTMWFNSYSTYKFLRQGSFTDMIIADGMVGINKGTTPVATLDVNGHMFVQGGVGTAGNSQGSWISWNKVFSGYGETDFINNRGTGSGGFRFSHTYDGVTFTQMAHIGVTGVMTCVAYAQFSDLTFKENIQTLESPMEKLRNIRGVNFDWREDTERLFPEGRQIGFIAQEIEEEFPELVGTDTEGHKTVAYDKFTAILLEAVKQQQTEIELLESRLEALESR